MSGASIFLTIFTASAQTEKDKKIMSDAEWREMSKKASENVQGYTWEDATLLLENSLYQVVGEASLDKNPHE